MNRNLLIGGGIITALAAALLINCRTTRPSSAVTPPVDSGPNPQARAENGPPAPTDPATERPAASAANSAVDEPTKSGTERLAERRNLTTPATTPALDAMNRFDRDEMVLLAQIQKRVNRPPAPAVQELIERRRSGASFQELWSLADAKLANDPEMLLAVRGWLNEVVRPAEQREQGSQPETKPEGQPLDLGGTVTPVKK